MLVGLEPRPLVWLRYTLFYALYPIGAGSEASLIFATLPRSSPVPSAKGTWKFTDYGRALLFLIWWPSE
jgi:very-long-chain (3R)-3-hydroxyacyl-CoA dehydratase